MRVTINQMWRWVGCAVFILVLSSCAQTAQLREVERDLKKKISVLNQEKQVIEESIGQDKKDLSAQRAQIKSQSTEMRKSHAKIKSDMARLKDEMSVALYDGLEKEVYRTQQLEKKVDSIRQEVAGLTQLQEQQHNNRGGQITDLHSKIEGLVTKIEEALEKQGQKVATTMTDFKNSLNGFKKALEEVDKRISQERIRTSKAEEQLKNSFEGAQAAFTKKLDADTETLKTYLERDVKASIDGVNTSLASREEQEKQLIVRLEMLESHYSVLSKKLDTDTKSLRTYLEQDVRESRKTSFQGLEKKIEGDIARLHGDVKSYEVHVQDLNTVILGVRDALEAVVGRLSKRGDDQILQMGQITERLNQLAQTQPSLADEVTSNAQANSVLAQSLDQTRDNLDARVQEQVQRTRELIETLNALEQNQLALAKKVDIDSQTLNSHFDKVNNSITSVAKALEQTKTSLTSRIESQERRLTEPSADLGSTPELRNELASNIKHLNKLTDTVSQLRDLVNSIGAKMGARVDQHDRDLTDLNKLADTVDQLRNLVTSIRTKIKTKVDRHDRDLKFLGEQLKRVQGKGIGGQAD